MSEVIPEGEPVKVKRETLPLFGAYKSEMIVLIPPEQRKMYKDEIQRVWGRGFTTNTIIDWILFSLRQVKNINLTPPEEHILVMDKEGIISPIHTKSDFTAIHEALMAGQAVTGEMLEQIKVDHARKRAGEEYTGWASGFVNGAIRHMEDLIKIMIDSKRIPPELGKELTLMFKKNPIAMSAPVTLMALWSTAQSFLVKMSAWNSKIVREANRKEQGNIPDWHDMINIAFYDPKVKKQTQDVLLDMGISGEYHDTIFKTAKTILSSNEIMQVFWREDIDEAKRDELMHKAGFEGEELTLMNKLFERIPSVQDLIQMAVREAWNEDIARTFNYDDDFPKEFEEWTVKQGFSPDWAKRWWRAHWALPSFNQGADMFHRGVLSWDGLNKLMQANDIPTFYREKLLETTFTLPARVDIRRFYDIGIYTAEDVYKAYRKRGYNDEDAKAYTMFTVLHNQPEERALNKAQIEQGFILGVISKNDAEGELKEIGYSDDDSEYIIELLDSKEELKELKIRLDILHERYIKGELETQVTVEELNKLGIKTERIKLYMDEWTLDKEKKTQKPSTDTLRRWLRTELITEVEFRDEMHAIGWSDKYIEIYVKDI